MREATASRRAEISAASRSNASITRTSAAMIIAPPAASTGMRAFSARAETIDGGSRLISKRAAPDSRCASPAVTPRSAASEARAPASTAGPAAIVSKGLKSSTSMPSDSAKNWSVWGSSEVPPVR